MRISVALCTYNGETYIAQQIQSILDQTHPVDEIIISDDGSKDNTLSVAESLLKTASVDYKIQRNVPAKGVADNFLSAIKLTTGDYIFTCDQDDVWLPDKVACFVDWAQKNPGELYFSDGHLVDGNCTSLGVGLWQANGIAYDAICANALMHTVIKRPIVTGAAMMISRQLVNRVDQVPVGWLHDEWFAIIAALANGAVPIPEKTFYYRQHGRNVVGAKKKNLMDRTYIWLKGFEDLHILHQQRWKKCKDVAKAAESTAYASLAATAVSFWEDLVSLKHCGRIRGLGMITDYLRKGYYSAFFSSYRSYIRDALFVLFAPKCAKK